MKLREMEGLAPFIDWTKYVNHILTEEVLQVRFYSIYFSIQQFKYYCSKCRLMGMKRS